MRKSLLFLIAFAAAAFPSLAFANTGPIANLDSYHLAPEAGPFVFDVLANDTDADGDPLTIIGLTPGQYTSSARIVGGKTIEYTPRPIYAGFTGNDTLWYTISDGQGGSSQGVLKITNSKPVVVADRYFSFGHEVLPPLDVLANDSDADGDPLTITMSPSAVASVVDNKIVFTQPKASASATFAVNDGRGGTTTSTVFVQPLDTRAAPVIGSESVRVTAQAGIQSPQPQYVEEASYFVEYGLDATYGQATPVRRRTLTYTDYKMAVVLADLQPGTTYHYRFVVTIRGVTSRSADLTVTTTTAEFGLPILFASESQERRVTAFNRDGRLRTLAKGIGGGPLVQGGDGAIYVADPDAGKVHRVSLDGQVSVYAENLARPSGLAFDADGNLYVAVESGPTASSIVRIAVNGAATEFAQNIPRVAELTVDRNGSIYTAPVTAGAITRIDTAGQVSAFSKSGVYATSVTVNRTLSRYLAIYPALKRVETMDTTGFVLQSTLISQGPVSLAPTGNYTSSDPYSFYVSTTDGAILQANTFSTYRDFTFAATVADHLSAAAQIVPRALPVERVSSTGAILGGRFNTAGHKVSVTIAYRPGSDGTIQYTQPVEYEPQLASQEITTTVTGLRRGTAYESWIIVDEPGITVFRPASSATVHFTTTTTDSAPAADSFHLLLADAPFTLDVLANDLSQANNPLAITAVTQGLRGRVEIRDNKLVYTPRLGPSAHTGHNVILGDYDGNDAFSYTTTDAIGTQKTVSVELVNGAPIAASEAVALARGGTITRDLKEIGISDPDGDPLALSLEGAPAHGQVTFSGTSYSYTAGATYVSGDEFRYQISDGAGKTAVGRVQLYLPETAIDATVARGGQVEGMPDGVTYASFGIPTLNDAGAVAFTATIRGATGNQKGVFVARAPAPATPIAGAVKVALVGETAPGLDRARFAVLGEPVLDRLGRVTFSGRATAGARSLSGIWSDASGELKLVAATGSPANVTPAATFKDFTGLAVTTDGSAIFTATLAAPAGGDTGLWVQQADGTLKCVLREGDPVTVGEEQRRVKSLAVFGALSGTADQRRGTSGSGTVMVRAGLAGGGEALLRTAPDGTLQTIAEAERPGVLGLGTVTSSTVILNVGGSGSFAERYSAFFKAGATIQAHRFGFAPPHASEGATVAEVGEIAPGVPGANLIRFTALGDPVANAFGDVAFLGTLQVAPPVIPAGTNGGIWLAPAGESPRLVMRRGTAAPGLPGAKVTAFTSVALPGARGVAFVGTATFPPPQSIPPRPAPAPVKGLWAQDRNGEFQLLLRTGAPVGTSTVNVRDFTVLAAVPVVGSQGRSANATGGFAARVVYQDGTQGIVTLWVP